MEKVCFEISNFAYPIRLVQIGANEFRVDYGVSETGGNYEQAALALGKSIMHALACDSKLDCERMGI